MRKLFSLAAVTGLFAVLAQGSQAAVVTFAQFTELDQSLQNTQVFALNNPNTTTTGNGQNSTFGVRDPAAALVLFAFKDLAPTSVLGQQIQAVVTLTAKSNGSLFGQGTTISPFRQNFANVTLMLTAQSSSGTFQTLANGTHVLNGTNLLTLNSQIATPNPAGDQFSGQRNSGTLSGGDDPGINDVVFTSFYIPDLVNHQQDDYALGFTSITPILARVGSAGLSTAGIRSFTAAAIGTFDTEQNVPEPGALALMVGMGVSGSVFAMRRRKK